MKSKSERNADYDAEAMRDAHLPPDVSRAERMAYHRKHWVLTPLTPEAETMLAVMVAQHGLTEVEELRVVEGASHEAIQFYNDTVRPVNIERATQFALYRRDYARLRRVKGCLQQLDSLLNCLHWAMGEVEMIDEYHVAPLDVPRPDIPTHNELHAMADRVWAAIKAEEGRVA